LKYQNEKDSAFFSRSGELVAGLCGATRANAKQRADQTIGTGGGLVFIQNRVKDGKIVEYRDIVQDIPKKRKRRYCVLNLARFRAKSSVKFVKNPNLVTDSPKERVKFKPKFKADIFALNANLSRLCLIFAARRI
jgi:hypothetical protein